MGRKDLMRGLSRWRSRALRVLLAWLLLAGNSFGGLAQGPPTNASAPDVPFGPFDSSDVDLANEIGIYRELDRRMEEGWMYTTSSKGGGVLVPSREPVLKEFVASGRMTDIQAADQLERFRHATRGYRQEVRDRLAQLYKVRAERSTRNGSTPGHKAQGVVRGIWQTLCLDEKRWSAVGGVFELTFAGDGTVRGEFRYGTTPHPAHESNVDEWGNATGKMEVFEVDSSIHFFLWQAYVEGVAGQPRLTQGRIRPIRNTPCRVGTIEQTRS